jgi:S-adenosylmethionine:tRNA ribosyltransferase-isomerase
LIAQEHARPRDASRLLVVRGDALEHRIFRELPDILRDDDLLVLNDTRVVPARVRGRRLPTGGRVELLLLRPVAQTQYDTKAKLWFDLSKPGRKARVGDRIEFGHLGSALVGAVHADGTREIELDLAVSLEEFLGATGRLPLPPYVHTDSEENQQDYQTVFAVNPGSIAAPTAALHFTSETFTALERRGIQTCALTLQIGLGTFRPMRTESIDAHKMHAESFEISGDTARTIADAKASGRRIVAVGTTVARALEAAAEEDGMPRRGVAQTKLFITPGFRFRVVDAMLTNFHLPRSTLLVLVSAFAGRERVMRAYEEAIRRRYRFFSFGDVMLLQH